MRLVPLVAMCASAPVLAQGRPPPRHLLEAPILTIRPHGTLAAFNGEGVKLVVGWRPVGDAAKYRVTITNSASSASDLETTEPRVEKLGLPPGRYHLTVTAIDKSGSEGAISEALPINVIEIHAVPPGADGAMPPTRNAYAVGTRFSAPGMHCETGNAPLDDLLVGPENELRVTKPGLITLRCAGIPGYLEKQIVIAPIKLASQTPALRGATTTVHVTIGTVARVGAKLDVTAVGDISIGPTTRTEFGLDIPVTATDQAGSATLVIRAGDFELGQVRLALGEASMTMPPPPEPTATTRWKALDLGAQLGGFAPPTAGGGASTIGWPTDPNDVITDGALIGGRLGFFPTRRVGAEAELSVIAAGYVGGGDSQILSSRIQLAARVLEISRVGLRLFGGTGAWIPLREHGTSQRAANGEVHAGAAVTVATTANLWLRFQLADVVTTARDGGYAQCLEIQLGIVTRLGRRDSF